MMTPITNTIADWLEAAARWVRGLGGGGPGPIRPPPPPPPQ